MSSLWTRSTNALSRLLDADEREAVFGDLVELGITDGSYEEYVEFGGKTPAQTMETLGTVVLLACSYIAGLSNLGIAIGRPMPGTLSDYRVVVTS